MSQHETSQEVSYHDSGFRVSCSGADDPWLEASDADGQLGQVLTLDVCKVDHAAETCYDNPLQNVEFMSDSDVVSPLPPLVPLTLSVRSSSRRLS